MDESFKEKKVMLYAADVHSVIDLKLMLAMCKSASPHVSQC